MIKFKLKSYTLEIPELKSTLKNNNNNNKDLSLIDCSMKSIDETS